MFLNPILIHIFFLAFQKGNKELYKKKVLKLSISFALEMRARFQTIYKQFRNHPIRIYFHPVGCSGMNSCTFQNH